MDISLFQLVIICATIAVVLGFGIRAARSVHSTKGFSVGGRSAGVPLVAGGIAGTCVGGGATVGTAQLAATAGLSAWWFTIGSGVGLIIMGLFYAKPLRRTALETIPQFLAQNFGLTCGVFSSIVSSIGILFSAVASCLPAIYIIAAIFGISFLPATILLVLAVAAYAFFGGMKSAGVGGILKMIVIWITMAIAGGMAAHSLFADPAIAAALPAGAFNLLHGDTGHILANFSSVVIGMLCTQSYIQAIFSASNPRTASVAAFTAALISLPVGLPCAMVGIYMGAAHPEVTPILSLPTYLLTEQPSLLGGIAMGGIMLSLIGSIAGLSLGIGTMLSRDIFHRARVTLRARKIHKIAEDPESQEIDITEIPTVNHPYHLSELSVTRLIVLLTIALAAFIAMVNEGSQVLFWNYLSMALRSGGIFLPLSFAIFAPGTITNLSATLSMVLSTASALLAVFLGAAGNPLFFGLAISALCLVPCWLRHR